MLHHYARMNWNRLMGRLTGRRPRLAPYGCAQILGRELEGGHYYLTSPDLPGFRATLAPEQLQDFATLTSALQPALDAYLRAYLRAQRGEDNKLKAQLTAGSLPRHGRSMNLVADLCPA
jgi:hypothetical protein